MRKNDIFHKAVEKNLKLELHWKYIHNERKEKIEKKSSYPVLYVDKVRFEFYIKESRCLMDIF